LIDFDGHCISRNFWRVQDPNQRMNEMINFSKNLALLGQRWR